MKRNLLTALFMSLCLSVASGCGDAGMSGNDLPDGGGADAGPDMAPLYPDWNAQSPAICGQPAYTWQPAANVGAVLQISKNLLPVPAAITSTLLATAYLGAQLNVHATPKYQVHTATIRYQTQDKGKLVDATAMVTWPTQSGKTFPVALFLHPTLGYTDECAPSRKASDVTSPMTIFSLIVASAGYVAVFPDYINQRSLGKASGHVTPYLVMEPTALASLDAVRAAQNYLSQNESVSASSDVYVWGHSQGAQAVEYVTAMQPIYAPELTIKAAAAVSPPSDVSASAKANFAGPAPTYNLGQAVAYAWSDYYDITQLSSAFNPPWETTTLPALTNYCNSNYNDPIKAVMDPRTVFTGPFLDAITIGVRKEPWSCWLYYNSPSTMTLPMNKKVPMLYVTGDLDTTVIPAANDPVTAKWCQQGVPIQYLQCLGADHTHTITNSVDDVLNFFDARQKGTPLPADICTPKPATRCASTR